MVTRFENWPILLANFIEQSERNPFKWGSNDCMIFTGKCVESLTGIDFYSKYLPYDTEKQAYDIIAEHGGMVKMLDDNLGKSHSNVRLASRGDVVLMKIPELTCGIVDDSGMNVVLTSKNGIIRRHLSTAWKVWSY